MVLLPPDCFKDLELFRQARTLVVISHRPATILWADRILVVDEGAIVDSGKHDKLILRCEAYRKIWQSQDKMPSMSPPRMEWTATAQWLPSCQETRRNLVIDETGTRIIC